MKIYSSFEKKRKDKCYAILDSDAWDDYGIKATFYLTLVIEGEQHNLGEIKIVDENKNSGRVSIKEGSDSLPPTACSLGQTIEYYKSLHRFGKEIEKDILTSLRDCAYNPDIYENFKSKSQFNSAIIRFSPAEQALQYAQDLYSKLEGPNLKPSYSFEFKTRLPGFGRNHHLHFDFFDQLSSKIPSNICVIIGRNGTGKTQILSDLSKAISGYGYAEQSELLSAREKKFPRDRPAFRNTIVVSYSAFDMFEIPGKNKFEQDELAKQGHIFGYKYCGLRERARKNEYRIKTASEVSDEFRSAVNAIKKRGDDESWTDCLEHILADPSFSSVDANNLGLIFDKLSSGQKITLSILAKVFEHIEPASIVIVDEPETHLHPSLMAAFMHSLRDILKKYGSYAIIATHSPVVLQETPSKFVQILAGTSLNPVVKRLGLESFGEEISTLTEQVFGLSFEESNFYAVLQRLDNEGLSLDEINSIFGKRLGLTARSFISDRSN